MGKVSSRSKAEIQAALDSLNLDPIKIKLMDPEEGEGWTREKANQVEVQYKRFLLLTVTHERPIVPTKDIDAFWHQHILDTRKYATDCQELFGFFLHHFPYFGMRGTEDHNNLQRSFAESAVLYQQEFGQAYQGNNHHAQNCSSCGAGSCGNCSSACAGTSCSGITLETAPIDVMNVDMRPTFDKAAA